MNSSDPVYVLIGGVSHTPVFFEQLIEALAAHGQDAVVVAYPTCGENIEHTKQWDEVIAIKREISHILDVQDRNVVLVMHSYGGWPGSRAVKGLDIDTREKQGKKTGIVELVFIAAFLIPDNAPVAKYSNLPPWLTVRNGRRIPNEAAAPLLFSDMPVSEHKSWLSKFAWQKNDFTAKTVPDAPWNLPLPKTYIITKQDKTATAEFQNQMLNGVMDRTWTVKTINAGHEPFLSQPKALAALLLQPPLSRMSSGKSSRSSKSGTSLHEAAAVHGLLGRGTMRFVDNGMIYHAD